MARLRTGRSVSLGGWGLHSRPRGHLGECASRDDLGLDSLMPSAPGSAPRCVAVPSHPSTAPIATRTATGHRFFKHALTGARVYPSPRHCTSPSPWGAGRSSWGDLSWGGQGRHESWCRAGGARFRRFGISGRTVYSIDMCRFRVASIAHVPRLFHTDADVLPRAWERPARPEKPWSGEIPEGSPRMISRKRRKSSLGYLQDLPTRPRRPRCAQDSQRRGRVIHRFQLGWTVSVRATIALDPLVRPGMLIGSSLFTSIPHLLRPQCQ